MRFRPMGMRVWLQPGGPADSNTQLIFPNLLADHDIAELTLALIITINNPLFWVLYKTENTDG